MFNVPNNLVCNCSARAYKVCKGFMTDCAISNDDLQYKYLHKISMIYYYYLDFYYLHFAAIVQLKKYVVFPVLSSMYLSIFDVIFVIL